MFSVLAGIGIAEYVRRRRLTLAGLDLKNSDLKKCIICVNIISVRRTQNVITRKN